ncbi:MAG: hypothetical protein ACOYVF_10045, partial [Candidatus Zixiibacteriota bacterium]
TADAGGTTRTIVDSALTEVDDYWNGAIGWFEGDTTTAALRGIFFHVQDFDATSDTLTLFRPLPAAPAAGDTYRLVLGGNYRGDIETFFMTAGGVQPELIAVTGTNITGLTIKKIATDAGTMTLWYDQSEDLLYMKMDYSNYGVGLDVSGDVTDGIIYDDTENSWVQVDVTSGSLPGSDQTDAFTIAYPSQTYTPDYEAPETYAGKTRYRLLVIKNTDGADTMVDLECWSNVYDGGHVDTIAAGESLTTAAGSFALDDGSDFPAKSFWVYNATQDDCRYVTHRIGNTLYCAACGAGLRGYTGTSWTAADSISIMPNIDLALDAPSTDQFENPASETTAPSGLTFGTYAYATNFSTLSIGDLAAGAIYGIWQREVIMESHRAETNLEASISFEWS